jgi:hypothetical protein
LLIAGVATAQTPQSANRDFNEESWYQSAPQPPVITPTQIIQAKAQARGQRRSDRIASLEWYGFSAARPRTNPTPFTGLYGAQWQAPGLRRDAWTPYAPTVIITR